MNYKERKPYKIRPRSGDFYKMICFNKKMGYQFKFYENIGPLYNYMLGPRFFFKRVRLEAMNVANIKPHENVLEVGVGTGLNLMNYPTDCNVIGIDISKNMLKSAQKLIKKKHWQNITLQKMDATDLQFENHSFDCVLGLLCVSASKDPINVMREMARVCSPKGRIIIANHFLSEKKLFAFF